MAGTTNKESIKSANKRIEDKKKLQKHLDAAFEIPKKKAVSNDEIRFEDDYDDIFEWYSSGGKKELTEVQKKQLERWDFARSCRKDDACYRNIDVANSLIAQFKISISQAHRDIANSKRLYKYLETVEYDFEKIMQIERIKKAIKAAELLGAKGINALPKLIHQLTIVYGFDKEKNEMPQPIDIHINVMDNPELVGGKRILNLQSQIDNVLQKALAEKIENAEDTSFEYV